MHIGYFSTQLSTPGGPGLHDMRALREIAEQDANNRYTVYDVSGRDTTELSLPENFTIRRLKPPGKWPVVTFGLTLELMRRPVDLLHATYVPPPFVPIPFITTMTCWSLYAQPECYPPLVRLRLRYLLDRGVPRSKAVFCYSQYLKGKAVERFGIDPERVFITQPGLGAEMRPIPDDEDRRAFLDGLGIGPQYILFVGSLTRRKNVHRLLEAYDLAVREARIPHQLVLVGETLFLSDEIFETIERLELSDRVVLPGRRLHSELPMLYSGADLFVFPTLSEGFGLPPLEAMACGTPVAASSVTSVPEVVGDAAILFDPLRPEEMADAILKSVTDDELRSELIEKGRRNAAKYSWANSATQLVSAYETVHEAGW